jgi:hypothetical protein
MWPALKYQVSSYSIEEGRAASKSPHSTFGYFLSISRQEVSADIIQNSAGTKAKAARSLFFLMSSPFLYILNSLQSSQTVYSFILPSLSAC